jgi:hypothetical protein
MTATPSSTTMLRRKDTEEPELLSFFFTNYWKDAGSQKPIVINRNDFDGRFIAVKLHLPKLNHKSKLDRQNPRKVIIASVYHPWNEDYEEFNNEL